MFDCVVLIDDKRYSVPTLWMTTINKLDEAKGMAEAKLVESNQYLRVQVFIDDELVCAVDRATYRHPIQTDLT